MNNFYLLVTLSRSLDLSHKGSHAHLIGCSFYNDTEQNEWYYFFI